MTEAAPGPFAIILGLVVLSLILFAIGLLLRRRGMLRTRGAVYLWAALVILPLAGSGLLLFVKHQVEYATGETQPGVSEDPANGH